MRRARASSSAVPVDHVHQFHMASAGSIALQHFALLQCCGINHRRIGFDAASKGGKLRPACPIGDLVEIEPAGDPDEDAVGQRRTIRDQEARVPDHLLEPVVAFDNALATPLLER